MRRLLAVGLVAAVLIAGTGLALEAGGVRLDGWPGGGAGSPAASAGSSAAASGAFAPGTPPASPSPSPSPSPAPTPVPTPLPLPVTALQAALDAWRASSATPGVSVTIRWADGRSWTGVAGVADAKTEAAVTADTAFPLASISKTFTAALVLELVQEGRLALDQPVAPMLPGLGLDPRITVRMLLDHTSGLPDVFSATGIDKALLASPDRVWSLTDSLAFVQKGRLTPGTRWTYSNTNYLLLGVLVEKVTGESFASLLRTTVLEPLGLDSAYVQIAEPARSPLASGHRLVRSGSTTRASVIRSGPVQPFASVVSAGGAADDVAASSADVARWAWMLYGGRVLQPASLAAMLDDIAATAKLHPRVPYGLGVEQPTLPTWGAAYGHNGHLDGFQLAMRYLPVQGLSIAVLSNANAAPVAPLLDTLLSIALPLGEPCARCS